MNPSYDFTNQVALVTGAGSGMGLATAQAFAQSGAAVVLADINPATVKDASAELASAGHQAPRRRMRRLRRAQCGRGGTGRRQHLRPIGHGVQQRRHPDPAV